MKSKFRRLTIALAIMLTTALMLNSIGATAITRDAHVDMSYKLDKPLLEQLTQMGDDDEIDVSIWVEDVDHNAVKEEAREEILRLAEAGEVSTDVLILLDEVESYAELEAQGAKEPTQEDTQTLIELERAIYRHKYNEKNAQIYKELFKDMEKSDKPTPNYLGIYAPNICVTLTKAQVFNIIESSSVNSVYLRDDDNDEVDDLSAYVVDSDIEDITRGTTLTNFDRYKDATGITSMQGLNTGLNSKVAILESSGIPYYNTLACFNYTYTNNRFKILSGTNYGTGRDHASKVTSVVVGNETGFTGVATDATIICHHQTYYQSDIYDNKHMVEKAITNGANIINMSYTTGSSGTENTYGEFSRWLDHIASYHHAHVCRSSGNSGSTGVSRGNMSYNALIVGSTKYANNTYSLSSYSSYCNDTSMQFKPDILAPGESITFPSNLGTYSGTSYSCPMVSGALALMIKQNVYMKYNPQFAKSALIAGTNRLTTNSTANSTATGQIAMTRPNGAGMMNVYNSYLATQDFTYCDVGEVISGNTFSTTRTFSVSSSDVSSSKRVRVCYCYNTTPKVNSDTDTDIHHMTTNTLTGDPIEITLTVTTPNGTVYRSNFKKENMQLVSFTPTQSGTYTMQVTSTQTVSENIRYGYTISKHTVY